MSPAVRFRRVGWLTVAAIFCLLVGAEPQRDRAETFTSFFGWDDAVVVNRRLAEDETRIEESVQACMREQGFEYIPHRPDTFSLPGSALSPAEFAAEYGFGIARQPAGHLPEEANPNAAVVAALPDQQKPKYVNALVAWPAYGDYGNGCVGKANADIRGGRDAILAPVRETMQELASAIARDPRSEAAEMAWRVCIGSAGFALASRDQLQDEIQQRIVIPLQRAGAPSTPEFQRIASLETKFAMAVDKCDQQIAPAELAVRTEVEGKYIADHRRELEDVRARAYPSG